MVIKLLQYLLKIQNNIFYFFQNKKAVLYFLLGESFLLYCFWITIKLFVKSIATKLYILRNIDNLIYRELCNHVLDQYEFL